jgi:hypothetical protein
MLPRIPEHICSLVTIMGGNTMPPRDPTAYLPAETTTARALRRATAARWNA